MFRRSSNSQIVINDTGILFGRNLDSILLFLPCSLFGILILGVTVEILPDIAREDRELTSLFIGIFYPGTLHDCLTFWVLGHSKESREWFQGPVHGDFGLCPSTGL